MDWMGYPLVVKRHGHEPDLASGMSHPSISPYDAYPTRDGRLVTVSVQNDREWVKLATDFLGHPELAHDPRYAANPGRVENRAEIDGYLKPAIAALEASEAVDALHRTGIACAVVNSVDEVAEHPQLVGRDRWLEVPAPHGPVSAPLAPPVSSTWSTPAGAVPALGEHTRAILRELGRDEVTIDQLAEAGVV
jgi:crotonobetainyl-CoA:carnitine CoA-transferase CaiB-like acyl-CoA transferase